MRHPIAHHLAVPWTLVLVACALAGCTSHSATPMSCVPGQTLACTCTSGNSGAQTCGDNGTYAPCACDADDAGADAGSDGDVVDSDCPACIFDFDLGPTDAPSTMDATLGDGAMDAPDALDGMADGPVDLVIPDIGMGLMCTAATCDVARLSSGGAIRCALITTGQTYCWGAAPIGNGAAMGSPTPTVLPGITDVTSLSVGASRACVLRTSTHGVPQCWGDNTAGQLGTGTSASPMLTPSPVVGLTDAVQIAVGATHICALRADGEVACWGDDTNGACGDGNLTGTLTTPTTIPGLSGVTALWSTAGASCARDGGGYVCWGSNATGQLGDGTEVPQPTPVNVLGIDTAQELALGIGFACARMPDGSVRCWGDNSRGQLGLGSSDLVLHINPVPVMGLANVVQLVAGGLNVCARQASGQVLCWGANDQGQVGDGTMVDRGAPTAVLGVTDAVLVHLATPGAGTVGMHPTSGCAVHRNGSVVCWGSNPGGVLGDGSTRNQTAPVMVTGLPTG